ncbi:hypothetical protein LN042_24170 [Kitasatospora sp. RB6PN24]|uniref:hypothetical protein n=1 Tax=Kitasatospora humi TaxID=2893891 RepID=UPI001E426B2B|nr:hypothetical protein [Kitasatospora humi]MCC9310126.1 hypothetical protein [Kitasatospora humi]
MSQVQTPPAQATNQQGQQVQPQAELAKPYAVDNLYAQVTDFAARFAAAVGTLQAAES